MKKSLVTLILTSMLLMGCGSNNNINNKLDVSVLCPTGAPSVAFYKYGSDTNFETNNNASEGILPSMIKGDKDVIILPTNAGVQAITKKNAPYKLAATITFGNLYLVATGHDEDKLLNDGDYIILFQQGQVPDLLFHYIFGDLYNSNIHYVSDAATASKCLKTGKDLTNDNKPVDYVLMAQPALESIYSLEDGMGIAANMQQAYYNKTEGKQIYQASVFINNSLDKSKGDAFLANLEKDINDGIKNPQLVKQELDKVNNLSSVYGIPSSEIIKTVISNGNSIGLGYKSAKENKDSIDTFLSLFNIETTNEEIYY